MNSDQPTEPLSAGAVAAIHDGVMRILEEIGIEFLNEKAKQILDGAGCTVARDSNNVRMDRAFVMQASTVQHNAQKS